MLSFESNSCITPPDEQNKYKCILQKLVIINK